MYCKFCGSVLAPNATKCASCGANINIYDGGQSFFDDNELDAWQNDRLASPYVPKTEMREIVEDDDFEENYKRVFEKKKSKPETKGAHAKKKKTITDYFRLSSSNKLIIFCIASALAIVLLVVAIIAVLKSDKEVTDPEQTQSTEYTQVAVSADSTQTNATEEIQKVEIKDIKVLINNKKVEHKASAYQIGGELFVSIDRILKYEGYKQGVARKDAENNVIYEHKDKKNQAIEIVKESQMICVKKENDKNEDLEWQTLKANCFNIEDGGDTYVHARSFFNIIGYSVVDYDKETNTLTVEK